MTIEPGAFVVISLQNPRERIWGRLRALQPTGVFVRGMDIHSFEDWCRQVKQEGADRLGTSELFFPAWRIERIDLDAGSSGGLSFAARFQRQVGREVGEFIPADAPE
ncbi:MAG TPA: hypothetical protein VGB99_03995 [Acidobacteriota bacterium]